MTQSPFTAVSLADKVLIRSQTVIVAAYLAQLARVQLCEAEHTALEVIAEATGYFAELGRRGYILSDAVFTAHKSMLRLLCEETIPSYTQNVLAHYMHPDGTLRKEWIDRTVNGVIPLSARIDWIAASTRAVATTAVHATDFVSLSTLTS